MAAELHCPFLVDFCEFALFDLSVSVGSLGLCLFVHAGSHFSSSSAGLSGVFVSASSHDLKQRKLMEKKN